MHSIQYPIRTVARLTGIAPDTLRAWERRYRAVEPGRAGRGRIYSEQDVQRLALLREAVDCGHSIGQVAGLADEALRELVRRSNRMASETGRAPGQGGGVTGPWVPVLESVASFDCGAANQQMGRLAALLTPRDLVHQVVLPLMRAIGEGCHSGRFTIAQEHMLSAILRNVLGSLVHMHAAGGRETTLLMATPAGELHEFGILAAALIASGSGLGVVYLGPNLPAAEISSAAEKSGARVVLLGVAGGNPISTVIKEVRFLARRLPAGTELWIGGTDAAAALRLAGMIRVLPIDDFDALERQLARHRGRS